VIPSKVYSILMVGRPILAVVPEASEVARIVREHRCGIVVDPDDPEAIRQAILWARDHRDALREMGERARRVGERFDRAVLAEQLLQEVAG
jgi:glycosyltransferase involved in cell wall biosynthesis